MFKWEVHRGEREGGGPFLVVMKMDLVQTLKLFVQQHLECIDLVRPGGSPLYAWNIMSNKDFQLVEGE